MKKILSFLFGLPLVIFSQFTVSSDGHFSFSSGALSTRGSTLLNLTDSLRSAVESRGFYLLIFVVIIGVLAFVLRKMGI